MVFNMNLFILLRTFGGHTDALRIISAVILCMDVKILNKYIKNVIVNIQAVKKIVFLEAFWHHIGLFKETDYFFVKDLPIALFLSFKMNKV